MYAIIKSGGKQHRVSQGQVLTLEKLAGEPGSTVQFDEVLMLADQDDISVGEPFLKGVKVTAKVVEHKRAAKVEIIKFKRRKHHMKHMGHRQHQTAVEIISIDKA